MSERRPGTGKKVLRMLDQVNGLAPIVHGIHWIQTRVQPFKVDPEVKTIFPII